MTRKEYTAIAEAVRNEYTHGDITLAQVEMMQRLIPSIGAAISRTGGLDVNGNRRFTTERFCIDAGIHRELAYGYHGQDPMYPGDTRLTEPYFHVREPSHEPCDCGKGSAPHPKGLHYMHEGA